MRIKTLVAHHRAPMSRAGHPPGVRGPSHVSEFLQLVAKSRADEIISETLLQLYRTLHLSIHVTHVNCGIAPRTPGCIPHAKRGVRLLIR